MRVLGIFGSLGTVGTHVKVRAGWGIAVDGREGHFGKGTTMYRFPMYLWEDREGF